MLKFECNTKPLSDSLNLGVINSNVSNFHKKSCIVELSCSSNILRINIEASNIYTEITIPGKVEGSFEGSLFVDSMLVKQLVATLDTPTVILEFNEWGLVIRSGKSKFTLPKMVDESDFELRRPEIPEYNSVEIELNKSEWKFIQDYQMYSIAMSFINPVYTKVWVGESGDVLVGDFDKSLFTHSKKNSLDCTCLLTDTIIHLFNSLPEGAKLIPLNDRSYLVHIDLDGYNYVTQFKPLYEDEPDVGVYNSEIFINMMEHPDTYSIIDTPSVSKSLSQATLLSNSTDDKVTLMVNKDNFAIVGSNISCQVASGGNYADSYECEFKLETLQKVISNYDDEDIYISPYIRDDEIVGILVWDDELTTIVAGVEE